jgi:hypothetical protein
MCGLPSHFSVAAGLADPARAPASGLSDVRDAQPGRQPPAATPAAFPQRFAKCAGLDKTQHHSVHLSRTVHNQLARHIKTIPVLHQMKPALVCAR